MIKKEEYIKKFTEQLKEWTKNVEEVRVKADQALAGTIAELDKHVEGLNQKKQIVTQKLQKMKEASAESWGRLKEELEKAGNDLKEALRAAKEKFK